MAAKLLHSLTDDNLDLQKQIGCMTGIFQLFDPQHILTGGRRMVGHTPKRLPPGNCDYSGDTLERESNNAHQRSASVEKYSHKNIQERQRISTESSSSSCSSSFSSLDCNRATQLDPAAFDRIIFPETPSRDSAMTLQNSSPQFSQQSRDLRDFVKDSMYREIQGLSVKAKTAEEAGDPIMKYRDTPRTHSEINDGSHGSGLGTKQRMPADLKEFFRGLAKLQEAPWHHNEPRELLRSSSYHAKDGSSFLISRDAPRLSYDGREVNRAPFDSRDVSKSTVKLKDLPRLSLDSKAGSMRSLHADFKSNFFLKPMQQDSGESDDKVHNLQQSPGHQARPPSVVAKLMGLETLPDSVSSIDTKSGSAQSYPDKDFINILRPFAERYPGSIQLSSSSEKLRKEPSSPRWRNPGSLMKPMSRFPIEPAPWKQIDGRRSSQKAGSRSTRAPAKAETSLSSVYSEIEKRFKDLEFTESGKDLRALKQIPEALQSKGYLQTQKEVPGSNFASHKDHDEKHASSKHEARSDRRKPQTEQVLASTKRRTTAARHIESPIVIMKPAKLVEKSGIPAASVIPLDGLSGAPKLQDNEFVDNRKSLSSGRTAKDLSSKASQRDNAVNSANMKMDRTPKTTQSSTRPQQLAKDGNAGLGKSSGSISPRMQQKKLELEKRSRPPTPPDAGKSRRQPNKQQGESNSPGGRRKPKHPNIQEISDKLSEVNVESRNLNYIENENSVQSNFSVATFEKSPGIRSCQSPSMKASEFMLSGLVEKNSSLALSEEESAEFGIVHLEHSSPVSVLDNIVPKHDSPSPVKYIGKTIKVDVSMEKERNSNVVQQNSADICIPNSRESGSISEINRKKLQNIENLVQKLRRLNSSHDEARTDYIASLCENADLDHRYISEILLASGLLLRDLDSSLTNFQFHPSGHPINPELFLVLEQTKASTLQEEECSPEMKTQLMIRGQVHRKLIFDTVNEILAKKLPSAGPFSEPWLRPLKLARKAFNAQKLLRELCSEIEVLQAKNHKCSSDEDGGRWKNILYEDVMHRQSESWTNFDDEISGAVLDVERSIFKDLLDEIVIGESAGLKAKPGRRS